MMDELKAGRSPVDEEDRRRAGWPDDWDKRDQVVAVADMITEPRSADWISEEADVHLDTARKHLNSLVEDGTLMTVTGDGGKTLYKPDPRTLVFDKVRELSDRSRAELTDELERIADEIEEWQDEYSVTSSDELRTTIDKSLDVAERRQRRQDAYDWERNEEVRQLINLALTVS